MERKVGPDAFLLTSLWFELNLVCVDRRDRALFSVASATLLEEVIWAQKRFGCCHRSFTRWSALYNLKNRHHEGCPTF